MEQLSTQTEFQSLELKEASELAFLLLDLQNTGAVSKHKAARQAGKLFNEIEKKGGNKALRETIDKLEELGITVPSKFTRRWRKEAQVSEMDFEKHLNEVREKSKELTDSGVAKAGKEKGKPVLLSAAAKILKSLSKWKDSSLIKSAIRREYAGTSEELQQVSILLKILSEQFRIAAEAIEQNNGIV